MFPMRCKTKRSSRSNQIVESSSMTYRKLNPCENDSSLYESSNRLNEYSGRHWFNGLSKLHFQSIFTRITPPSVSIFVFSVSSVSTMSIRVPTRKIGQVLWLIGSYWQPFRSEAFAWIFVRITLKRGNPMKFSTKMVKSNALDMCGGMSRSFSTGHHPSISHRPIPDREVFFFKHRPSRMEKTIDPEENDGKHRHSPVHLPFALEQKKKEFRFSHLVRFEQKTDTVTYLWQSLAKNNEQRLRCLF